MTSLHADGLEIVLNDESFQLLPGDEDRLTRYPLFEALRGAGVLDYAADFGAAHHLPGTVLSVEKVRDVVIGCEPKAQRWLLGLHVQLDRDAKAQWVELVRWPLGEDALYGRAAQQAGRHLAEMVGCPLKIFGAKKLPEAGPIAAPRSGITGPVEPHTREDITPERVRVYANSVRFPVQYPGMWLGQAKDGVTLRLAKDVSKGKRAETPSYSQCTVNPESGQIKLVPPTGLLGAFFGGPQGRTIPVSQTSNVELRLSIGRESVSQQAQDMITEVTHTTYTWGVYLTLKDESLLLAQTAHATSSELSRQRAMAGDKFAVDPRATMEYLRLHQADQDAYEAAETFAHTVAVVLARALNTRVVKTQVELAAL